MSRIQIIYLNYLETGKSLAVGHYARHPSEVLPRDVMYNADYVTRCLTVCHCVKTARHSVKILWRLATPTF